MGNLISSLLAGAARAVRFRNPGGVPGSGRRVDPVLRTAWDLYRDGDFAAARAAASQLISLDRSMDEARRILCLASHMTGDYAEAVGQYDRIRPSFPGRKHLVEPTAWSCIHLGDVPGAVRVLESAGFRLGTPLLNALRHWLEHPLEVKADGLAELPFTDDRLSPFMPGIRVRINGQEAVARLDTGASFLHLNTAWADRLGIRAAGRERSFAALSHDTIGYGGFANLELGSAALGNVPAYIHGKGLDPSSERLAAAFGVELGPIIGTNVLQQFLATLDGPGCRLILSPRGDPGGASAHAALLSGTATEVQFTMWSDHYMIARGSLGPAPVNLFVDSGLVVVNAEQGQAALLASKPVLKSWKTAVPDEGRLAVVPVALRLGELSAENPTAFPVSASTWKRFGDWGGVRVDALLSWGFLKACAWTIDFDRRMYVLRRPAAIEGG
ncbi:MAG TPA: retropepsin-like aspartic protease [Magnetospirillaceae bacterium]|nr:retropepsin-like aspartic protease [Magnetospirillaceae bacterium]